MSIRGWLECDEKQLAVIREVISSQDHHSYSGGWGFPRKSFNWTSYVFYGGDIRQQAVDWFLGQLKAIARIPASNSDNDRVQGLFLTSHEVDGMSEWQVRDGQVFILPADTRYRYFDV